MPEGKKFPYKLLLHTKKASYHSLFLDCSTNCSTNFILESVIHVNLKASYIIPILNSTLFSFQVRKVYFFGPIDGVHNLSQPFCKIPPGSKRFLCIWPH